MEIKNESKKLLFNDFEGEENKKSSSELDFYVKYKDLGLDNEKQYYCYFYEKPDTDKDFVFNEGDVPEIQKNVFDAYDVKYSCNKNCVGLRFFVTDKEITNDEAKDMSPEKNEDVTWYEVKQDEEGKKYIAKYNWNEKKWEKTNISFAYSDDYFSNKKRWKIGPYEKYGDHKFLTHFNNYSQILINCDKFQQIISNDINDLGVNANDTEFNPNVYACVKLHPDGDFYLDWSGNMKVNLASNSGTRNKHNGYMEDVFAMRFYITRQDVNFNVGNEVHNDTFSDPVSVFEYRRDENNNMVLWHLKNKEKNEWEVVDGEVIYYSMHCSIKNAATEQIAYNCTTQSENGIQKSYTVEILDILDDSKKIGENTVKINNTDNESLSMKNNLDNQNNQPKQQSNYHIGKTILFSLLAILVGFLFGWIYALIPIAAFIVIAFLDQKFDRLPGPKKIFCCFKCYSVSEPKKSTETINPELMVNSQNKINL